MFDHVTVRAKDFQVAADVVLAVAIPMVHDDTTEVVYATTNAGNGLSIAQRGSERNYWVTDLDWAFSVIRDLTALDAAKSFPVRSTYPRRPSNQFLSACFAVTTFSARAIAKFCAPSTPLVGEGLSAPLTLFLSYGKRFAITLARAIDLSCAPPVLDASHRQCTAARTRGWMKYSPSEATTFPRTVQSMTARLSWKRLATLHTSFAISGGGFQFGSARNAAQHLSGPTRLELYSTDLAYLHAGCYI